MQIRWLLLLGMALWATGGGSPEADIDRSGPASTIVDGNARFMVLSPRVEAGWRVIETSKAQVRYRRGAGPFEPGSPLPGTIRHGGSGWEACPSRRIVDSLPGSAIATAAME